MRDGHLHKGHRQRLKDKVRSGGLKVLSEHEVLELMLTYTIPQKDTNELSHSLINKFGSLSGVVDADYQELKKVVGVGEETALFMKVLQDFIEVYKQSKSNIKETTISSIADVVKHFRATQEIKNKEHLFIYGLSKRNTIVNKIEVEGMDDCEVSVDLKDIIQKVFVSNVNSIFIVHTHPHGSVVPSLADIKTTNRINDLCEVVGLKLHDHIVINQKDYFSFRQNNLIGDQRPKQYSPDDFDNKYISESEDGGNK